MSEADHTQPFIDRGIDYPIHQHYETLLQEGIRLIGTYSGEVWTNYNDSDPGITMLQNLCYALTELGFKTDLPIEDLLTGENGKIKYHDHFHTPDDILPMNPTTLDDFRKLLLSNMPEVKQVYIDPVVVAGLVNAWSIYLEVKPGSTAGITLARSGPLIAQANKLLRHHENIGQPFVTRFVLQPLLLQLSGTITLPGSGADEQTLAQIIIAFNHVLSPYPRYHTYSSMAAQGMRYDQLLEGPWLAGGYIPDTALATKRSHLSVEELNAALLPIPGIGDFNSLAMRTNLHKDYTSVLDFEQDTAPYVSWQSFKDVVILIGGQRWTAMNENKIDYYTRQLTPQPVANPRAQIELPHGIHRNVKKYYSIQHNFPAAYRLTGNGPSDMTAQAQVKQLKAYLTLFEQNLADHLAQLGNLANLFDFDSGSSTTRLAAHTYYTQPLFNVPGIRKVLKDADDEGDWTTYKNDNNNPYLQELEHIHHNPQTDMKRKKRLLEHLLARYGQARDPRYLPFVNPAYGDDASAEIGSLSDTLRAVSSLTADRARTYFMHRDHRFPVTGMELRLENILGLKSYYSGVIETVRSALQRDEGVCVIYYTATGPVTVHGTPPPQKHTPPPAAGYVEVYWNDDLMLIFATDTPPGSLLTAHQTLEYLMPSLAALRILSASNGLVLIDHAQLLRYQYFRWTVYDAGGTVLFETPELYYEEMIEDLALITGELPFYAELQNQGSYQITVRSSQVQYVLCDDIPTRQQADAIIQQLTQTRKDSTSSCFRLKIISNTEEIPFPGNGFHQQITLLFPDWVAAMNRADYRQFILEKVMSIAPAHIVSNIDFATLDEMEALLPPYRQWLEDVRLMNQLDFQHHFDNRAAFQVLKQLVDKKA